MSMSDPVGDLLTRIRNGLHAGKSVVTCPASNLKANVLEVLKREGYIRGYEKTNVRKGVDELKIELKYADGQPAIRRLARVSTPGRRLYTGVDNLPKINNGLGVAILSTPRGVMTDHDARAEHVGGEVLCEVF